jgi:hypothetical protein
MPRVNFGSFSLEAPGDWTLSTVILSGPPEANAASAGMLTTKAVQSFQQNVIATMEQVDAKETPESYVKRQLDGLRRANVQRKEMAPPKRLKLKSGAEGLVTEQAVVGPGGERVRQVQLVTIKNGIAHTLIASNLDGAPFEKSRAVFEQMLNSFA